MSIATPVYNQLLSLLSEYSPYRDLRQMISIGLDDQCTNL